MNNKIVSRYLPVFIVIFVMTSIDSAYINTDPEIEDAEGDTIFPYCDILTVEFYENEQENQYLFIKMDFKDLRWKWRIERTVGWTYNNVEYYVYHKVWNIGNVQSALYSEGIYNDIECEYDVYSGSILWKIDKTLLGNPNPGDILYNTNGFGGFEPSYLIGGGFVLFADFAPDSGYGNNYVIQY